MALVLSAGGCVYPCGSGVCNSRESLFHLPSTRYNSGRVLSGGQEFLDRDCKAKPYLTFNKYRPWCDSWTTTVTARRCADWILLRQQWHMKKLMSADYKGGFRQAFVDVAHGSDGELPAVPPPVYWNTHFRNDSGQQRAECWFSGYRAGSAMAAVRLAPMKRIAASYDWTVPDHAAPFAGGEYLSQGAVQQFPAALPGQPPQSGPQASQFVLPPSFGPQPPPGTIMMNPQLSPPHQRAPDSGGSLMPGFSDPGPPPREGLVY